jgi:hypothetical protein
MNAIPITTWINDLNDKELEELWSLLEIISTVPDIPKLLTEINKRNWAVNAGSARQVLDAEFIIINRGPFNSPMHNNGERRFEFENIDDNNI